MKALPYSEPILHVLVLQWKFSSSTLHYNNQGTLPQWAFLYITTSPAVRLFHLFNPFSSNLFGSTEQRVIYHATRHIWLQRGWLVGEGEEDEDWVGRRGGGDGGGWRNATFSLHCSLSWCLSIYREATAAKGKGLSQSNPAFLCNQHIAGCVHISPTTNFISHATVG